MSNHRIKTWFELYRVRIDLLVLSMCGVLGVTTFAKKEWYAASLLEHVYMAFAVSALVIIILELTFHQALAKNVFEAAIGYLLPEELIGELRWIYGKPFLCEDHTQTVLIRLIDGTSLVTLHCEVVRRFKNITGATQEFSPGLSIEENLHDGNPSRIIAYQCQLEGQERSKNWAEHLELDGVGFRVSQDANVVPPLKIQRGGVVTVYFAYEKTLHHNDFDYLHFGSPTSNVTVVVDAPANFLANVLFSHRDGDPEVVRTGPHTWKLRGVLLPLQAIRVTWCIREAYEKWKTNCGLPEPQASIGRKHDW